MVWKWITRLGVIVGLIGGSFAIYEFFRPINWVLLSLIVSGICFFFLTMSRIDREKRTEAKVDRLLAHFKIDQSDK